MNCHILIPLENRFCNPLAQQENIISSFPASFGFCWYKFFSVHIDNNNNKNDTNYIPFYFVIQDRSFFTFTLHLREYQEIVLLFVQKLPSFAVNKVCNIQFRKLQTSRIECNETYETKVVQRFGMHTFYVERNVIQIEQIYTL